LPFNAIEFLAILRVSFDLTLEAEHLTHIVPPVVAGGGDHVLELTPDLEQVDLAYREAE
jgi:hypothetical protein